MTEAETPPSGGGGPNVVMFVVTLVIGAVLFIAFSFLTFGLPLLVVAVAGALWCYVGLMRLVDYALGRLTAKGKR